jgi:hypothetical protein
MGREEVRHHLPAATATGATSDPAKAEGVRAALKALVNHPVFTLLWSIWMLGWMLTFWFEPEHNWVDWFNIVVLTALALAYTLKRNLPRLLSYFRMWNHMTWFTSATMIFQMASGSFHRMLGGNHDTLGWADRTMQQAAMRNSDPAVRAEILLFLVDLGTFMADPDDAMDIHRRLNEIANSKFEYAAGWHGDIHKRGES